MAAKYDLITELYLQTVTGLSEPDRWQAFLTTACRNFRLPFQEQVLLFVQRPDATAVLPIEGKNGWNQRFGRWVNRGSKGIAMFDSSYTGKSRLKYYFDIADTHESSRPRPVPIWEVQPGYEAEIVESLENSFGQLKEKADLGAALVSAASNAMEDHFSDYLAELSYYKEGSFLEPLDEESLEALFKPLLQNSIGYMLLVRCGIDPDNHFTNADFDYIKGFNTLPVLNALRKYPAAIAELTERISGYEQDVAIAQAHPKPAEAFVGMEILGTVYTERKDAGKTIINACTALTSSDPVPLGQYRGFSLTLVYDSAKTDYRLTLKGHLSHTISLSADASGNITRMDNAVDGLEKTLADLREDLRDVKTQLANAKAEMEAPFAKEAELTEKSARLKELNILLNMDQKDKSLLDEAPEEVASDKPKNRDYER